MIFSREAQNFFYLGGGGFAPVRGQKILEIIDFPDPGGGWSPIPPPLNTPLKRTDLKSKFS